MYLEKIRIKNFRGFDEKGIEACFNNGVNAIIGENNVGKSAVIDAMRIAFTTMQYQRDIFFKESDFHVDSSGQKMREAQFDLYLADVPMELYEIWLPESGNHGEFHIKFYLSKTASGEERVKNRAWGGPLEGNILSSEIFDSIDISYLGALRDAEDGLRPSKNSRLATLLKTVANSDEKRQELVTILKSAHESLKTQESIKKIRDIINNNLDSIEQEVLSQRIDVGFTEPQFESISSTIRSWVSMKWIRIDRSEEEAVFVKITELLRNRSYSNCIEVFDDYLLINLPVFLRLANDNHDYTPEVDNVIKQHSQIFELRQNGLGYNNLIYMSTILGDMSVEKDGIYHKLLLVEEPEAHLHPQLQELIYDFFIKQQQDKKIQIIFTSHSPTLVSRINLDQINLLYDKNHKISCFPMSKCIATTIPSEKIHLQKYLDVTRAQLFFAKGLIFVEGISEALLIPEMAKALNRPLKKYAVEVINVDGLAFKPFAHLLYCNDENPSFCKAAIVTDDDRCSQKGNEFYISADTDYDNADLEEIAAKLDKGNVSERYMSIKELCTEAEIELCGATKTLEYELAFSEKNISVIVNFLKEQYTQLGEALQDKIDQCKNNREKQILIWLFIRSRARCKADLAQSISELISQGIIDHEIYFDIPDYLKKAIYYVTESPNGDE